MKTKKIKILAKSKKTGAYFCDATKGNFIAEGVESKIESCCIVWKTAEGFKGAFTGKSDRDNPLHFTKADIRFGGTSDRLKIKVDDQTCTSQRFILLIRMKPTDTKFIGAHWMKMSSEDGYFGGYICATEEDYLTIQNLMAEMYKSSKTDKPQRWITMTDSIGQRLRCVNEEITVRIGGED